MVAGSGGYAAVAPPPSMPAGSPSSPAVAHPTRTFKPDKGFFDDPMAVDPGTDDLVLLRTDSASFAKLETVDLSTGKFKAVIDIGDPHPVFERVVPVGHGRGIILIIRDSGTGRRSAQYFGTDGKPAGMAGPAADFGVATREGKQLLAAWDKTTAANGDTTYAVQAHEMAPGLARVGKLQVVAANRAGEMKKPPFKIISWQDGYSQIVGQRPGAYDSKKDFRQPDQAAVFDMLTGTFAATWEIGDIYGWAQVTELRAKHFNRTYFPLMAADGSSFDFADGRGTRTAAKLPVPLQFYDPKSLQDEEDAHAGRLMFSLAVDPLNPEALARKKADVPYLDVYATKMPSHALQPGADRAAQASTTARLLLRATLDARPVAWVVSPHFVVLLRKFKSFSRGGGEIEVFPAGDEPSRVPK